MPRKKPTTKIDQIGCLDIKPEDAVPDYIESKNQEKYYTSESMGDAAAEDNIDLLMIQNAREHFKMVQLQNEMAENSKLQNFMNKQRVKDITKAEQELRQQFIDCNTFIKDCEKKKAETIKQIEEENSMLSVLENKIKNLSVSIDELKDFKGVIADTVQKLEPYETVIQEVVKKSDILKSVKDCTTACDALINVQQEVSAMEDDKCKQMSDMLKELVKVTNDSAFLVLGMNNELTRLERTYSNLQTECRKWESTLTTVFNSIAEHSLTRERILDGIYQLYGLLCRRSGTSMDLCRTDVAPMLDFIKEEVWILRAVLEKLEKKN